MDKEKPPYIAVIGLGYVGLPLAIEFAKKYPVVGYDINSKRIEELASGFDYTLETDAEELKKVLRKKPSGDSPGLFCTDQSANISDCNFYIVTVPTPIDKNNHPDLGPLIRSTQTVGKYLKKGDIVIYESTVYPGVTGEICVPALEKVCGLKFNSDFFCGYSPERINPGDKEHSVAKILKITSGSTPAIAKKVDNLYLSIITAGTYSAASIKVAEAAKVIENAQRDINIAFVNELAKIFNLLEIDTTEVLEAAATKWNFLNFKPGLVGGHCIGVGSFYLAKKAQELGYEPEIIMAGRRVNDSMGVYVAGETIKLMVKKEIPVKNAKVLILGFTFKENCTDVRNTRVIDIVKELENYHANVSIYDPLADPLISEQEYGIKTSRTVTGKYDAVILAVAHDEFKHLNIKNLLNEKSVVYDVKGIVLKEIADARL